MPEFTPDDIRPREFRGRRAFRRYPPLVSVVVALLIAFLVLPSALTLPQANPSTVLEYAPVPPDDEAPPPSSEGSVSELGLGTTSSLSTGSPPKVSTPLPGGTGDLPITKRCVGEPLRQTEDPNAPPCVPFFDSENGGETWQGVTGDQVVVLVYASPSISFGGSEGGEQSPSGTYCDTDAPPESDPNCLDQAKGLVDHVEVRVARAMSRYFNERFQTYGRHVKVVVYYSATGESATPATRRADAQDNFKAWEPFAVIDRAFFGGHNAVYAEAMARRNVSVYGNFGALENAFYKRLAPFVWSFWPDVERWTEQFVSYVCTKVAPYKVSHAGDDKQTAQMNGRERRYALMSTTDEEFDGLQTFASVVESRLRAGCPNGSRVNIVEEVTFPRNAWQTDTHPSAPQSARENVARMQAAGVTTVLWLGGYETEHSKAAFQAGWFPEWVVAGDLLNDGIANARGQQQDVWRHARVATNFLREDRLEDAPCRQAYREAAPDGSRTDEDQSCIVYRPFFQLFRAIQVAGPDLSPFTVDQGMHAIARSSSPNPHTAACFFEPGDYTCVKDAQESWWDPDAPDPEGDVDTRGCWRMVDGGVRFLAWEWPSGDTKAFTQGPEQAPCNTVDTDAFINPYGPAG